jgi:hypothetical protein
MLSLSAAQNGKEIDIHAALFRLQGSLMVVQKGTDTIEYGTSETIMLTHAIEDIPAPRRDISQERNRE